MNDFKPNAQPSDIIHWLLQILQVVNTGGKLAPEKAISKLLNKLINTYGHERVWEGVKQLSLTFRVGDALRVEALFHAHPDLPELLKTDHEAHKALNGWFETHPADVTRFHKISSTVLMLESKWIFTTSRISLLTSSFIW